jgi:CubicO group peptidase (beta-lactamase class C family)
MHTAQLVRIAFLFMLTMPLGLPASVAGPADTGFSAGRLERIDRKMNEAVAKGLMAGGQGLIVRNGTVVYDRVWGAADRERSVPTEKDTLYRIYSMTKPITSVALLMLYEEGHFLLNDPISQYLPEFASVQVLETSEDDEPVLRSPQRPPTIRDLLRHSAGLSYGVFGKTPVDESYLEAGLFEQRDLESFTRVLAGLPLQNDPGTRWHYSVAADVQGRLIEVLSDLSLGDFFHQRIFEPLGMNDTYFGLPESKRARLAQLYSPKGAVAAWDRVWTFNRQTELEVADPELSRPYFESGFFESGGAGLISSTHDYLRFALMLLGEGAVGDVRLLSPSTVRLMRSDHLGDMDRSELGGRDAFGLGVGISGNPAGKGGEIGANGSYYGWGGAAGTEFWVDPEQSIIGIFMTQSIPHQTKLSQHFRVLTYQAFLE